MRHALVLVAIVVSLVLVLGWAGQLPDPVTTHFVASGAPDGTMSRQALVLAMVALLVLVPPSIPWLTARALRRGRFNIPNAAYWLAPERHAATVRYLERFGAIAGVQAAAYLCFNFWLLVHANVAGGGAVHLDTTLFLGGLGACLLVTVGSVIAIHRRFAHPLP